MWRGECWTRDTSEFHRGAAECSLSDILEPLPPYECYSTEQIPQWFKGELQRRTYGHHVSFHFLSGLRASSMEISQFLLGRARIHMRVLTVRECERLMGLPDGWTWPGIALSETPLLFQSLSGSEKAS